MPPLLSGGDPGYDARVTEADATDPAGVRVVVVGASAGGVPALTRLVSRLDGDLVAAVLVVLHLPADGRSLLAGILDRAGPLPAANPRDRERLVSGQIYVAPPDQHLLVDDSMVRVTRGPRENGYRPSVDALFRSAASWFGPAVTGVVLTGALDDGAAGLAEIVRQGGHAIVQDPAEAGVPDMPTHALEAVPDAQVSRLDAIAQWLNRRVGTGAPTIVEATRRLDESAAGAELAVQRGERRYPEDVYREAAGIACPDCAGSLFVLDEQSRVRFRCRVGHGWTGDALLAAQGRELEQALWAAIRVLEDGHAVNERLAARASRRGRQAAVQGLEQRRAARERLIAALRSAITHFGSAGVGDSDDAPRGEHGDFLHDLAAGGVEAEEPLV